MAKTPKATVRKGMTSTGQVRVTKPAKGLAAKLIDKALKAAGK